MQSLRAWADQRLTTSHQAWLYSISPLMRLSATSPGKDEAKDNEHELNWTKCTRKRISYVNFVFDLTPVLDTALCVCVVAIIIIITNFDHNYYHHQLWPSSRDTHVIMTRPINYLWSIKHHLHIQILLYSSQCQGYGSRGLSMLLCLKLVRPVGRSKLGIL